MQVLFFCAIKLVTKFGGYSMEKEVLEKAKEKIIAMAVADVEKGKYSVEILQIIMSGICDIQQKEYKEEQEKHKAEKEKDNKEYAELLARMIAK